MVLLLFQPCMKNVRNKQNCKKEQRKNGLQAKAINCPMADAGKGEDKGKAGITPFPDALRYFRDDKCQCTKNLESNKSISKIFRVAQMLDAFFSKLGLRCQGRQNAFKQEYYRCC